MLLETKEMKEELEKYRANNKANISLGVYAEKQFKAAL